MICRVRRPVCVTVSEIWIVAPAAAPPRAAAAVLGDACVVVAAGRHVKSPGVELELRGPAEQIAARDLERMPVST